MPDNPYTAPLASQEQAIAMAGVGQLEYASQNKRLLHLLIDTLVIYFLCAMAGVGVGVVMVVSGAAIEELSPLASSAIGYAIGIPIYIGYFVVLEGAVGATIGKLLTGTRVVNADGLAPTIGQVLGRTLLRIIPFEPLSFLIGDTTTGLHDSLSGTRVINKRAR